MFISEWINVLKEAYSVSGKVFTKEMEKIVIIDISQADIARIQNFLDDACDSMMILFFKKAVTGNTFGSLDKIRKRFGETLEERYRLKSGVFLNFARTYWTFKLEISDLILELKKIHVYIILCPLLILQ